MSYFFYMSIVTIILHLIPNKWNLNMDLILPFHSTIEHVDAQL